LAWTASFDPRALKELERLDRTTQRRVVKYLQERVLNKAKPRTLGKALTGGKVGLWRYRMGDYRIICDIRDAAKVVHILRIGQRNDVYR
jgi:mRNA interferase RelE/StbE